MTRLIQVANNATTTLASGITAVATTLTVAPGDGAKFPALSGSQYFKATLVKATGEIEVVKVTAKATDTFTIVRANEVVRGASTAYAFNAGDKVECRWTSNSITDELDRLDAAALNSVANKTANYSVLASDISNLLRVDTTAGAIAITLPQISTLTDDFAVLVSKVTSDGNAVTITRSSTNTINGAATYLLTSQWQSAWLIADRSTNTWTAINSSTGSISTVLDTFAGSGTAGPFTLTSDPGSKNNLAVFVGGTYQEKSTFTLAGTSLTLGGTVASGVNVEAIYNTPVGIGVPSDGTVTTAKLGDRSVTTAKLADSTAGFSIINGTLAATVASSALTIAIKTKAGADPSAADPVLVLFRNATAATGDYTVITLTAATSFVVSSGSTMGTTSAVASRLWIVGFNDAGTFRLGAINCRSGFNVYPLGDDFIESSTAEGGAGGADSAGVFYTGTASTTKAYRILGYVESTQATAGTWATAPSKIQLFGAGVHKPGDIIQERVQQLGSLFSTALNIPFDDTIPQISEGGEIFNQPITPRSGLSVLQFDVDLATAGTNVLAEYVTVAVFKDAAVDAIAAGTQSAPNSGVNTPFQARITSFALAAATAPATYTVRSGASTGTLTVNGTAGARRLGGVASSVFKIKEIAT